MAIAVTNTGINDGETVSALNVSAADRKLITAISIRDITDTDRDITSVIRNSQSATEAATPPTTGNVEAATWYRNNPSTGSHDNVITFGGNIGFIGHGCLVVSGADITGSGLKASDSVAATGANPSVSAATDTGGLLVAVITKDTGGAIAPNETGWTNLYTYGTRRRSAWYKLIATGGTHTFSYTEASHTHAILLTSWSPAATTPVVGPAALDSASTIDSPTITPLPVVGPAALDSASTIDSPTITPLPVVGPAALDSASTIDSPTVTTAVTTVEPAALDSASTIDSPTITPLPVVGPAALDSASTIDSPTVTTAVTTVEPAALDSASTIDSPTITTATAGIVPAALDSASTIDSPTITPLPVIAPADSDVSATISSPAITVEVLVSPSPLNVSSTVAAVNVFTTKVELTGEALTTIDLSVERCTIDTTTERTTTA